MANGNLNRTKFIFLSIRVKVEYANVALILYDRIFLVWYIIVIFFFNLTESVFYSERNNNKDKYRSFGDISLR